MNRFVLAIIGLLLICAGGCSTKKPDGPVLPSNTEAHPRTTNAFGLYLAVEPVSTDSPLGNGWPSQVPWRRPYGSADFDWLHIPLQPNPILTTADIVKVDLGNGFIQLTPESLKRLPNPMHGTSVPLRGMPFVCVVDGQRVCPGVFWTLYSSFSPPADVSIPLDPTPGASCLMLLWQKRTPGQLHPWSDPRIEGILEGLHKLGPVDVNSRPTRMAFQKKCSGPIRQTVFRIATYRQPVQRAEGVFATRVLLPID